MELKSYLRLLKKERRLIIGCALIAGVSAWAGTSCLPTKYDTSVSLFIEQTGTQATPDFKYDGYYALQSGEAIADHVEQLLQSPQLVEQIYRDSQVDPACKSLKSYKKKFTAHKLSNLYVEVDFQAESAAQARSLAGAIGRDVNQQLAAMNTASGSEIAYSVADAQPVVVPNRTDPALSGLIGLISGLCLGIFATCLKKYLS